MTDTLLTPECSSLRSFDDLATVKEDRVLCVTDRIYDVIATYGDPTYRLMGRVPHVSRDDGSRRVLVMRVMEHADYGYEQMSVVERPDGTIERDAASEADLMMLGETIGQTTGALRCMLRNVRWGNTVERSYV